MSYVETYYSGTDFGNYSLLNNYIYKKQTDLVNIPANYYVNPDSDKKNINYSSITMDYDDNGIKGGTDHNVYTPEESYIILESVPKLSEIPGDKVWLGATNSIEFNIPCDGILRYFLTTSWSNSKYAFMINDVKIDVITINAGFAYGITELMHSFPIRVNKSDRVKLTSTEEGLAANSFYFLPFTYPWE